VSGQAKDALEVLRKGSSPTAQRRLASAKTTKQTEAARGGADRRSASSTAGRGMVAGSLAISDLDVDVLGLADVLSADYDPRAAGLTVKGRGGASGKRLFSGATGSNLGIPGFGSVG